MSDSQVAETPKKRGRPKKAPPSAAAVNAGLDEATKIQQAQDAASEPQAVGTSVDPVRAYMAELMAKGLSGDEINMLTTAKFGGQDNPGQSARPVTAGEQIGDDPEMIRLAKERLKDYVPQAMEDQIAALDATDPALSSIIRDALADHVDEAELDRVVKQLADALHGFGGVTLRKQFCEWVTHYGAWESARRKMSTAMPIADVLGLIVRDHWAKHPHERAMLQGTSGGTGPKDMFNPSEGAWQN